MSVDLPSIDILSRNHVKSLLRRVALQGTADQIPHLVSISHPEDGPPREVENHPGRTLILTFHDIAEPKARLTMPSRNDVAAIVRFAGGINPGEHTVCHCNAGISRSSAAALTIMASKLEPNAENAQRCITELLAIKNIIHPNRAMVQYADELLGYQGRLVGAYRSTFGGGNDLFWLL
jgi:predicted protein tyrosine phosphatase